MRIKGEKKFNDIKKLPPQGSRINLALIENHGIRSNKSKESGKD